ncbi:SxtJ family membrane protein [Candidatus Pelagibacter sp.]|nr:SxtJ family membrane protein [Candidatus Pelagibacter sp.]
MENIKLPSNRSFGFVFAALFFLIGIYPIIHSEELRIWSLIIATLFLFLGAINSKILNPLNFLWLKFGIYLGKIISPLIMGIIFFLVVTPIGLLMKIFKKDPLNLKYNSNKTYWIKKTGPKSKMKNQF